MKIERRPGAASAALDWQDVVRMEAPALQRWAGRMSGAAEAQDVVQDAVLRLLEGGTAGVRSPRAILYSAVSTVAKDRSRRSKVRREAREELAHLGRLDGVRTPEDSAVLAGEVQTLAAALRRLPAAWREALLANRLHDEPVDRLARRFGVSRRTIERWIERSLRRCRHVRFAPRGGELEVVHPSARAGAWPRPAHQPSGGRPMTPKEKAAPGGLGQPQPAPLTLEQAQIRIAGLEKRVEAFRLVLLSVLEPPALEDAARLLEVTLAVGAGRARQLLGLPPGHWADGTLAPPAGAPSPEALLLGADEA